MMNGRRCNLNNVSIRGELTEGDGEICMNDPILRTCSWGRRGVEMNDTKMDRIEKLFQLLMCEGIFGITESDMRNDFPDFWYLQLLIKKFWKF